MKDVHACFISYRHPGDPRADQFVLKFKEVLASQLSWYLPNASVYLDKERLGVGNFFKPELASELCRSACMVMFYGPCHFEATHPFCALEYHAMRDLETERLETTACLKNQGLIFPVILRGSDFVPKEIHEQRNCLILERDIVQPCDFGKRKNEALIMSLAKGIFDRYRALHNAGVFSGHDCSNYSFPTVKTVTDWIVSVSPLSRFPGH